MKIVQLCLYPFALLALLAGAAGYAQDAPPDRASLIAAWEKTMASLPGTVRFEPREEGRYLLVDENLPYDGEVELIGAVVRNAEMPVGGGFTYTGFVDFRLTDLSEERLATQGYYFWLADRQTFHYSPEQGAWLDASAWQESFTDYYSGHDSFGVFSFMLNYGIWILLIALVAWLFVVAARHTRKARTLIDDSASLNERARENLDRAEKIQQEMIQVVRESLAVQKDSNEILKRLLEEARRDNERS